MSLNANEMKYSYNIIDNSHKHGL